MANIHNDKSTDDVFLSAKSKNQPRYIQNMADYWIGKLVYVKHHIPTCRKYYSGVRDTEEFEYITDNYGIGNPMDLNFTPIIKPRIDALVGLYLGESFSYRVSIADSKTLDLESEDKKNFVIGRLMNDVTNNLQEYEAFFKNKRDGVEGMPPSKKFSGEYVNKMKEALDKDFTTVYAEAAQHLIQYFEQSNTLLMKRKFAELLYDLLITGEMFWRTYIKEQGKDPILEVVKPENLFYNKNKNDIFLDTADAIVHREYMTRHAVLQRYGHLMTSDDVNKLFVKRSASKYGGRVSDPEIVYEELHNEQYSTSNQFTGDNLETVEVFHVEWLASSKYDKKPTQAENPVDRPEALGKQAWIEHRYEVIRIGGDIYVGGGKSKDQVRTQNDPYKASLSYSGVSYNQRQGEPYSMVWNLKDTQDMYDIMQYHRNNLVANAGVAGTRVNLAGIPKILGSDFMERLMKWVALRKQGIELIDPTEEGAQLFNHYGEFNGGLDGNALNGITTIMQTLEHQVVLTTGVTDQMLGQIEQREAVENVKTGIRQVSLITLNIFDLLDQSRQTALGSLIDLSKISYTKGKQGSYKVGARSIAFKIDKSHYTWTDYNIQVTNSSKDTMKLQKLEAIVQELIGAGIVKPETAIELILANTIFEAKAIVAKGMANDNEKDQQMQQMQQKLEEYESQLKDAGAEANKSQQEKDKANTEKLALDKDKFQFEKETKRLELAILDNKQKAEQRFKEGELQAKEAIVALEREQLYSVNAPSNSKEVNNNKI